MGLGNVGLYIQGALQAQGTASQPITFTSASATPSPGDWTGLFFDGASASSSQLAYVSLHYAGRSYVADYTPCFQCGGREGGFGGWLCTAAGYLGSPVGGANGYNCATESILLRTADPSFDHLTIQNGQTDALYVMSDVPPLQLTNAHFLSNGGFAIHIQNVASLPAHPGSLDMGRNQNGSYPNWGSAIAIDGGTLTSGMTVSATQALTYSVLGYVTISSTAMLALAPGSTVLGWTNAGLYIQGTLLAQGTASQPITFTSASATPSPGDWTGLFFDGASASGSQLSYVSIQYAGRSYVADYTPCFQCGGRYGGFGGWLCTAAGYLGSPVGGTNGFNCATESILLRTADPSFDHLTVQNGQTDALYVMSDVPPLQLTNAHFLSNGGYAIHLQSIASLPAQMSTFDIGANQSAAYPNAGSAIAIDGGTLTTTVTASQPLTYTLLGYSMISSTATLSLAPGSVVLAGGNTGLYIQGTLLAQGTASQPITFTSASSTPSPGDWTGLFFDGANASGSQLSYVSVQYAGRSYVSDYTPCFQCGGRYGGFGGWLCTAAGYLGSAIGGANGYNCINTAVLLSGSSPIFNDITVTDSNGFGLTDRNNSNILMNSSTIRRSATYGVIQQSSAATINNSSIISNSASGISSDAASAMTLNNSSVIANMGSNGGGIISSGAITLTNSTISQNTAQYGGGLYSTGTTVLSNAIIANNTASTSGPDCYGGVTSGGYNLIQNTAGCTIGGSTNNITGQSPLLGPLQANGGPTLTELPLSGSPASDQIPLANCPQTDQRGYPRPDDNEGFCDIGAVESGVAGPAPPEVQVLTGASPALFFPQGGQTTTISSTILGLLSDPGFTHTPLTVTVTIANSTGATVATLDAGSHNPIDHWLWTGTTSSGALAAPDVYTATVSARVASYFAVTNSVTVTVQSDGPIPLPCQTGLAQGSRNSTNDPQDQHIIDHVNTQSGDFTTDAADLAPLGASARLGLEWHRYYNSQCSGSGPFGPGWTFTYYEHLNIVNNSGGITLTHILEDGQQETLVSLGNNTFGVPGQNQNGTGANASPSRDIVTYNPATNHYISPYCKHGCGATFDGNGNLIGLSDTHSTALGNGEYTPAVGLTYNGAGLTAITDTAGQTLTVVSDPTSGVISQMSDPQGDTWSYGYDSNGYLTSVTFSSLSSAPQVLARYSYGGSSLSPRVFVIGTHHVTTSGRDTSRLHAHVTATRLGVRHRWLRPAAITGNLPMTAMQNAISGTTTITYNAAGQASSVTDPLSQTTSFSYATALITSSATGPATATLVIDPLGGTRQDYYDSHGRLRASVDPTGVVARQNVDLSYDPIGTVLTGTQGLIRSESSYDANGNLTRAVDGQGDTSTSQYDALGDLVGQTDARGFGSANGYDAQGNLLTSTDALGNQSSAAYDAQGDQTSLTDASGHTTLSAYDAQGNLISTTDALSNTSSTSYGPLGHPLVVTNTLGQVTRYAYDTLGRTIAVTDPQGAVTQYGYDTLGDTTAVTDALGGVTHNAYNSAGQLISTTDALGNLTQYGYDALGDTTVVTDALGSVTHSYYDDQGRLISSTDALGVRTVLNQYDSAGQLITTTNALGQSTNYAYDAAGRLLTQTDALGNQTTYGYDAVGNTIAITDALGDVTQSAYDGNGRLITSEDALGNRPPTGMTRWAAPSP